MSTPSPWIDEELAREKDASQAPLVTIFGAGVSGLTAAHELIERGFIVQVVEPQQDPDDEYGCLVGGLAANQLVHTPADLKECHPHLFDRDVDGEEACTVGPANLVAWVFSQADEQLVVRVGSQTPVTIAVAAAHTREATAAKVLAAVNGFDGVSAALATPTRILVTSTVAGEAARVSFRRDEVGGIVPSQVVRFEDLRILGRMRSVSMIQAPPRFPFPERLRFKRTSKATNWKTEEDDHGVSNQLKLDEIWARLQEAHTAFLADRERRMAATAVEGQAPIRDFELSDRTRHREELVVEIRGHTDSEESDLDADRTLSCQWAGWVRSAVILRNTIEGNPIDGLAESLLTIGLGQLDPIGNPRREEGRARDNRVEIRVVENVLPGEHGYRFFPRFYRHLFDTMKRTPILDAQGSESGQTAFDQLEATEHVDVALRDKRPPQSVPVRRPDSLEDLRKLIRIHLDEKKLGVTSTDLLKFQIRILKFLTSSKARREQEYEDLSWMDFLVGREPGAKKPREQDIYTRKMIKLLRDSPQALVAMNADETDARSQGVIYTQLLLDGLGDGKDANRTLNGPTSSVWLDHWKVYLKRQGVRFYQGRLTQLQWGVREDGGHELVPVVEMRNGTSSSLSLRIRSRDIRGGIRIETVTIVPAQGLDGLTAVTRDLADRINASEDLIIEAEPEMIIPAGSADPVAGVVHLRSLLQSDGTQLRVIQPAPNLLLRIGAIDLRINGVHVLGQADQRLPIQEQLHAAIQDSGDIPLRVGLRGSQLVVVTPEEEWALVSVEQEGLLRYALWVDDHLIEAEFPDAPNSEEVVHALGVKLADLNYVAKAMGTDGLLISGPRHERPAVQLGSTRGLRFGANFDFAPLWSGILEVEGRNPRVVSLDPSIGVIGNQAEQASEALIESELGLDGTLDAAPGGGPDFYVLAVPFEEASKLIWDAEAAKPDTMDGCLKQMQKFELATDRRKPDGEVLPPKRNHDGRPVDHDDEGSEIPARYPLRELSGIQYYFENHVRVGRGHSYFPDAPWGLSSISQLAYWRLRMSARSAFLGQLSVDIGHWYKSYQRQRKTVQYPSAWRSTIDEIAERTWEQILEGLWQGKAKLAVPPRWYHLDDGIRFEHEGVHSFGAAALLRATPLFGSDCKLTIAGQDLAVSADADEDTIVDNLVAAVEAQTPHLATKLVKVEEREDPNDAATTRVVVSPRLAIAPLAEVSPPVPGGETALKIAVEAARADAKYRLRINGVDVSVHTAVAGDTPIIIRDALAASVDLEVPHVLVLTDPAEPTLTIKSTAEIKASALAVPDGASEFEALLEIDSRQVFSVSGLELLTPVGGATPIRNATPFLINPPKTWKHRPGLTAFPNLPHEERHEGAVPSQGEERAINYEPTCDRWLMAGNQMATHTRLSTMEAANESARHAVIAILHKLARTAVDVGLYHGAGKMFGDTPEIFDPELNEVDDLLPLRRLDQALATHKPQGSLVAEPIPHLFDILRIQELVDQAAEYKALPPDAKQLTQLLERAGPSLAKDWAFSDLDEIQTALQTLMASLVAIEATPD